MSIRRSLDATTVTADGIVQVLVEAGIDTVFGISGGHMGKLFGALSKRQDVIRTVLTRDESLASAMAETYGRLTGKPGVIIGQGPWVMGNGLLGILEAHLSSTPMLVLTDLSDTPAFALHGPYQAGSGQYGSWDAKQSFTGVSKLVIPAVEPETAIQATQLAVKHALSGQPGPVVVLYSGRALTASVGADTMPRVYPTKYYMPTASSANADQVDAAVAALRAAGKPVLVLGNGVRVGGAYREVLEFAETVGLPVVTSTTGKGTFAETHALSLGAFGTYGTEAANTCVGDSDVIVVVGSKLTATDVARENPALLDPERQTFIQIDTEPRNASWTFPAEHTLIGPAKTVVRQLTEAWKGRGYGKGDGAARAASYRDRFGYIDDITGEMAKRPISPRVAIKELNRALPEDAIVTCDAGENRILMSHYYRTRSQGGFVQASGSGPMGYAIPAALGAKLANPGRVVASVSGDGGFSMTMNGLLTAKEQKIPIISVIFNNSVLGWSMHAQSTFANTFDDFDYAAIGRAMGCEGFRVTDPAEIAPAIEKAIQANVPAVIDIVTSHEITYRDVTSPLAK